MAGDTELRVEVNELTLEDIRFCCFAPLNASGNLPALIYYLGGCFISGDFDTHDKQLRQLAFYSGCRVIAAQYRLVPEYRRPAARATALCLKSAGRRSMAARPVYP